MDCAQNGCSLPGVNSCTACGRLFCAKHFCHPNSGNLVCLSCFRENIRNQDIVGSRIFLVLGVLSLIATAVWWQGGGPCFGILTAMFFFGAVILLLLKGHIGVYGVFNKRHIPLFDKKEDQEQIQKVRKS